MKESQLNGSHITQNNMPNYNDFFQPQQNDSQLGNKKGDLIDKEAKSKKDIKIVKDFIQKREIKDACCLIETILSYDAECKEAKLLYIECLAKLGDIQKVNIATTKIKKNDLFIILNKKSFNCKTIKEKLFSKSNLKYIKKIKIRRIKFLMKLVQKLRIPLNFIF